MASVPAVQVNTLQAGRAIAAIAVVCLHAGDYLRTYAGASAGLAARAFAHGGLGVDFFFVLSGFIIFYCNAGCAGERFDGSRFALSRATRIYVPYLPLGILYGVAYTFLPALGAGNTSWSWLSTLTLLPSGKFPALSVAWTLQHEIVFYALAFIMLKTGQVLRLSLAWGSAIVLADVLGYKAVGLWLLDLEFLFGMAAAYLGARRFSRADYALALAGCALVAAYFMFSSHVSSVVFALGLALILPLVVKAELAGKIGVNKVPIFLGGASYAIYLIHPLAMNLASRALRGLEPPILLTLLIGISVAAGIAYHLLFEAPALRWVRRGLKAASQRRAA
jgi:peptidoglycan/LPS O-acetylase OafA/YrhL